MCIFCAAGGGRSCAADAGRAGYAICGRRSAEIVQAEDDSARADPGE